MGKVVINAWIIYISYFIVNKKCVNTFKLDSCSCSFLLFIFLVRDINYEDFFRIVIAYNIYDRFIKVVQLVIVTS